MQRLLADMESFKQQVQAVQLCQSALRVPEEVMPNLAICRTALRLQQEASQLQHVAIQQCNILQVQQGAPSLQRCNIILFSIQCRVSVERHSWQLESQCCYANILRSALLLDSEKII